MDRKRALKNAAFFAALTALVCLVSLSAATYAWFTSNQRVSTSRVEARTGSTGVELLISETGGSAFRGSNEAALVQINKTDAEALLPVSTADLKTFLYSPGTLENRATQFFPVENEACYYHARVYLQAAAENAAASERLALYFDQSVSAGGLLVTDTEADGGLLCNAARLGLTFDGASPVILTLSDESNPASDQVRNTVLNGAVVPDGQVLTLRGDDVTAVDDPAVPIERFSIDTGAGDPSLPARPLLEMELNRIYALDVYFYLEGCDPDCSDSVSFDSADLHLAFFGVLA